MSIWMEELDELRPDQIEYFSHLIRSWYGWVPGQTGWVMPSSLYVREIRSRLRKAYRTTLNNRP